ncbi:MAG TPA: hypothetical protein VFN76_07135, partial [Candidatus Limnocylindria bacterium]|nr:hypothetical protein [Candidatus Limnocylindria bacterium]
LSLTSQKPRTRKDAEPGPVAEAAAEAVELNRNVLAIIGAYRMGTALDPQALSVTGGAGAAPQLAERSPV